MPELPKAYVAEEYEDAIAKTERLSGFYNPDQLPGSREKTFAVILPPPNATGTLHIGHAVMLAIQDVVVRFQRMRGKKSLWLPGTDHAAIATQVKVEKLLAQEEHKTRHDLGREAFLKRVDAFVEKSRATIRHQIEKMGCSIDWSREAFTLDEARNLAVRTCFKRMYDDRLIYRGHRVINWDPKGQTVISDDELVYEERQATLYTFHYGKDVPIPIATTRPETKVGDTAIAVHPKGRWKKYIGREYDVEFAGASLHLRVIGDEQIDETFGTGALGVTPAHSMVDAEMAQRHTLPMVQVIDEHAQMTDAAGELVRGMSVQDAREHIVAWLKENDLMLGEQEITQNVSTAERTGEVIEPLPKLQWFIDVNKEFAFSQSKHAPIRGLKNGKKVTLKRLLQHTVKSGQVGIIPDRFEATYFHWIDHLRDWCISRQLWYGHRIPVWYCVACGKGASEEAMKRCKEPIVSTENVTSCPHCGGAVKQDPDTLDTWFSAGLWTFSTLGWPDESALDLQTYHPTALLETGRDILFFWVARMILMSTYCLGEVPFRYAYLHGLVRDGQGRKMSKSLDNIIDPLDMIKAYGTDAVRLSLVIGSTPGNDLNLPKERIAGFRNFTNKLWNITRFVFMNVREVVRVDVSPKPVTAADRWILGRLAAVHASVTAKLEEPVFALSQAGEELRDFTWSDFADWYIEVAKGQLKDEHQMSSTEQILLYVSQTLLKLWHPFMPFVTQRLWQEVDEDGLLLVEAWPDALETKPDEAFSRVKDVVTMIRNLRATYRVPERTAVPVTLISAQCDFWKDMEPMIRTLVLVESLSVCDVAESGAQYAVASLGDTEVRVHLAGAIDVKAEIARLMSAWQDVEDYVKQQEKKLKNKAFVKAAPVEVVDGERRKLDEACAKRDAYRAQLDALT